MDEPVDVPVSGAWRPATRDAARAAALARRLGLTTSPATAVLRFRSTPSSGYAIAIAAELRRADPVPARTGSLSDFAAAHPPPPGTSPHSGTAVQRTVRTMGRTGLPLLQAWGRVRDQLDDERGGPSAATALHAGATTFVVVHDMRRAPLEPAGIRAIYAWRSAADGPALGRPGDGLNPPRRKDAG